MASAVVDTTYLSSTYSFPRESFDSLITTPTTELVEALLQQLSAFGKDHDALKLDKLKTDVQLESAVRTAESRVQQFKRNAEANLKQVDDLRAKLNHSGMVTTTFC